MSALISMHFIVEAIWLTIDHHPDYEGMTVIASGVFPLIIYMYDYSNKVEMNSYKLQLIWL